MQILHLLFVYFVNSTFLPISDLTAGKQLSPVEQAISHSQVAAAKILYSLKGAGKEHSSNTHIQNPGTQLAGGKRFFNDIHGSGITSFGSNGPLTPKDINASPLNEVGRKQKLQKIKNDLKPLPKPKLKRQQSFTTNFNKDFDQQGDVGACHVFATLEVVHDITKGLKLSKERLFLDNMVASGNLHFGSVDDLVNYNLREIQRIRTLQGSEKCAESIQWEGGDIIKNFELLKTYGGIVVPHNGDWKNVEHIMSKIKEAQENAIFTWNFNPQNEGEKLWSAITPIFDRGAHRPEEWFSRMVVSNILNGFEPEFHYFLNSRDNLRKHTYSLIKIIAKKGTAFLAVYKDRFYRGAGITGPKLTWALDRPQGANHAVALVGYSVGKKEFYIKDSNTPRLIEMSPKDLFLSMNSAVVLVPKGSSHIKYNYY